MHESHKRQSFFLRQHESVSSRKKKQTMEIDLLAAAVHSEPIEANLVHLLDEWSSTWKCKGRTRAIGPGAYEKCCTLVLDAHGSVSGISRTSDNEDACRSVIF